MNIEDFNNFEKAPDYAESKCVIVPMDIFTLIHSHEFKLLEPTLTDKIMNEGLESLTPEESERFKRLQIDLSYHFNQVFNTPHTDRK
jgi:hypothetical protein